VAVITKVYVRISHSVAGLPLCAKVELHPGVSWVGDTMAVRTVSRAVPTGEVWGGGGGGGVSHPPNNCACGQFQVNEHKFR
jgi:hypothetical protein